MKEAVDTRRCRQEGHSVVPCGPGAAFLVGRVGPGSGCCGGRLPGITFLLTVTPGLRVRLPRRPSPSLGQGKESARPLTPVTLPLGGQIGFCSVVSCRILWTRSHGTEQKQWSSSA